jgi:uncharacterized surface protein with fasciclin (FAS1) repeats
LPPAAEKRAQKVQGEDPTATMDGKTLVLNDAKGDAWRVTTGDVYQSNGVIHVVRSRKGAALRHATGVST